MATVPRWHPSRPMRPFPSHVLAPRTSPVMSPDSRRLRHIRTLPALGPSITTRTLPPPSLSPPHGAPSWAPILSLFPSLLRLEATKRTPLHFRVSPRHYTLPRPLPVAIVCTPSIELPSTVGTSSQCHLDHPNSMSIAIPAFLLQLVGTSPLPSPF
jgi:hypothetical protein